ncbi:unnamed protein product [Dicrocoelium dendriticum]|nr:unnamed protein product [Dicrocoelium dendriticum]
MVRQHWKVSESNFNLTCKDQSSTCASISNGRLSLDWLGAPNGFSYKCTKPSLVRAFDAAGSPTTQALRFQWIQMRLLR